MRAGTFEWGWDHFKAMLVSFRVNYWTWTVVKGSETILWGEIKRLETRIVKSLSVRESSKRGN